MNLEYRWGQCRVIDTVLPHCHDTSAFREEISVSCDLAKMSHAEGDQQRLASSAAIDDEHRQDPDYLRS